ncbi:MAG: hypothetical protein IPJ84_00280 [Bdellovibrionales bacterium]|nr:hypothetical protein [Bdellovibrionales bacterium]
MSKASVLFKKAWDLRDARKIEACKEIQSRLRQTTGLSPQEEIELRLLAVSTLRADGDLAKSWALLDEVSRLADDTGESFPFQFYFQKALNCLFVGQLTTALEFFIKSKDKSVDAADKQKALVNILLCLENLGLAADGTLVELERLARDNRDKQVKSRIRKIVETYRQRQSFRDGQITAVYAAKVDDSDFQQMEYYKLWVSELPYVAASWDLKEEYLAEMSSSSSLHLKSFRLQTILGGDRFSSEQTAPIGEECDRLYLWTWRWIMEAGEQRQRLLSELLIGFDYATSLKRMSCEDVQIVRNALRWIGLLCPDLKPKFHDFLRTLESQNIPSFPIYEFELLWIRYLEALRKREKGLTDRLRRSIEEHPLASHRELQFQSIGDLISSRFTSDTTQSNAILVDSETGQIKSSGKVILISQPAARLIDALVERESLRFDDALDIAFDIRPYDDGVHCAKIYNLIARIKKVLPPSVILQTRDRRIYFRDPRLRISITRDRITPTLNLKALKLTIDSQTLRRDTVDRWIHPRLVLKKALGGRKQLSRTELQSLIKASKATTNRWIKLWITQGLIQRTGQGRTTAYRIDIA